MELEIFDATTHTRDWPKSESDLDEIVSTLETVKANGGAPVKFDHVEQGAAMGWVESLKRAGTKLIATLRDVQPELVDAVNSKRYPNRSVELYSPGNKIHGLEGKGAFRALAFLGAAVPESKALAPVTFGEDFISFNSIIQKGDDNMDGKEMAGLIAQKDEEIGALKNERDALKAQIATYQEQQADAEAVKKECETLKGQVAAYQESQIRGWMDRLKERCASPALLSAYQTYIAEKDGESRFQEVYGSLEQKPTDPVADDKRANVEFGERAAVIPPSTNAPVPGSDEDIDLKFSEAMQSNPGADPMKTFDRIVRESAK